MNTQVTLLGALALAASASAQSDIYGVNLRLGDAFMSQTADFVNNYVQLANEGRPLYGLDFDASGSTLYAIDSTTLEVVTIDLGTGISTPNGTTATGIGSLTGLASDPDGVTWYASEFDGADTLLYTGDIATGVFTLVGTIDAGIIIDISVDSQGNLYAFSITNNSIYTVDTATGVGTVVGQVGLNANFAQGMDFDWSTDTLYAAIYTGGGTGQFCSIDLATGLATQLFDTFGLNAEMEMAVRPPVNTGLGTNYCAANANSTGATGVLTAAGSPSAVDNDVTLTAESLPNTAFGFFLTSQMQAFVQNPGGSAGNLCLGGAIGRYVGPGQIQNTGQVGSFSLVLDLTQIPSPTGFVAVQAGETWNFTAWHRDSVGGQAVSNFTDGLSITFQ